MSNTIRITKTKELEKILAEIKAQFPLLDDAEIVKMIISEYYVNLKAEDPTPPKMLEKASEETPSPANQTQKPLHKTKKQRELEEADDFITLYSDEEVGL